MSVADVPPPVAGPPAAVRPLPVAAPEASSVTPGAHQYDEGEQRQDPRRDRAGCHGTANGHGVVHVSSQNVW